MRAAKSGKADLHRRAVVAVISSSADLERAVRLRRLPHFFELRLDMLAPEIGKVDRLADRLGAPFIVTARHPSEGGINNLSTSARRELLLRFLPRASFVDVELRSTAALADVLELSKRLKTKRIISVHDLRRTPPPASLLALAKRAHAASADIFKVATHVDTSTGLARLFAAFEMMRRVLPVSAMGIGKLGRASRLELFARGSVLNYGHLNRTHVDGQLGFDELRKVGR